MAIAGRVAIVPKGEWSQSVTYDKLDLVTHNGNTFVAYKSSVGVEPIDGDTWMLVMQGIDPQEIDNIINGTTPVGNAKDADTVDGYHAHEFRPYYPANDKAFSDIVKARLDWENDYMRWRTRNSADGALYPTMVDNADTVDGKHASDFLPITGGTVGKAIPSPLNVHNTTADALYSLLGFYANSALMGHLGFYGVDNPVFYTSNGGTKKLLHTGNKPTGTYTGNGSATKRTIVTGGIGSVCMVAGNGYISFGVAGSGGFGVKLSTGEVIGHGTGLYVDGNGNIAVSSEHQALNESGKEYRYFIL